MSQVIIRRCASCPTIKSHTGGVVKALEAQLGADPRIVDGAIGEFTVLVDSRIVFQKKSDVLPSTEQIIGVVRQAVPAPV